jgi:transposase
MKMLSTTEGGVRDRVTIGLDIVTGFHEHGSNAADRAVFSLQDYAQQFARPFGTKPCCRVALEACGRAHHWARELKAIAVRSFDIVRVHETVSETTCGC